MALNMAPIHTIHFVTQTILTHALLWRLLRSPEPMSDEFGSRIGRRDLDNLPSPR